VSPPSMTSEIYPQPRSPSLGTVEGAYVRIWKPGIDRVLAFILILLSVPVMVLLAVVIRITLGQGVFFCQSRIGQHGRPFNVLKFRTMLPDRRRAQVPIPFPDRRCTHKAKHDPRHTRIGRFLRRWSLDELPQLFNVAQGQMSLIGPRPELPAVVARYEPWQHVRHNVKPGMTGLWQVVARGVDPMEERMDLDIYYVQSLCPALDLKILMATAKAVIVRCGE
jgi:lipopolysaccharide/colanic/teichoic acid biosynthesis glycosyltransferase